MTDAELDRIERRCLAGRKLTQAEADVAVGMGLEYRGRVKPGLVPSIEATGAAARAGATQHRSIDHAINEWSREHDWRTPAVEFSRGLLR